MRRINGEKVGRRSLRLDAAYCALLGAGLIVWATSIADGVALPPLLIAGVGIAVIVWAAAIVWMLARLPLRAVLRVVMVANIGAAFAVAFVSAAAATLLFVLAIVLVAAEVGLFAASQAIALRALPTRA